MLKDYQRKIEFTSKIQKPFNKQWFIFGVNYPFGVSDGGGVNFCTFWLSSKQIQMFFFQKHILDVNSIYLEFIVGVVDKKYILACGGCHGRG